MDHMRISGTVPSSVILRQTKYFKKLKSDVKKVPNKLKCVALSVVDGAESGAAYLAIGLDILKLSATTVFHFLENILSF